MILLCVDFFENYSKDSKQGSKHALNNFQVSILVHITYYFCPLVNPANVDFDIFKEVHYYVFDDINHDSFFVQHAFMLHWNHLQGQGYTPKQHIVWTYG